MASRILEQNTATVCNLKYRKSHRGKKNRDFRRGLLHAAADGQAARFFLAP